MPWVAAVAIAASAQAALASVRLTLMPGAVAGGVNEVGMKRGETVRWVAMRYGVNPVRVRADQEDGDLLVDTRHVVPAFDPDANGIVLNVPECEVYLVHDGEIVKHYPVAVSAPDKPVPLGLTRVVCKEKNPPWFIPVSIQKEMRGRLRAGRTVVPPGPRNPLGPRWIGFWNGNFGMHGTNVPTSIKQYASHGCVRFRAGDIKDLYDRVSLGTPIRIVYQPVLLGVDDESIWLQVYPDIYKKGFDYKGAVATLAHLTGLQDRVNWKAVALAVSRHNGIITNIGPGGGFRQAIDPTASVQEATYGTSATHHKLPAVKPVAPKPPAPPRPEERLIPEDEMNGVPDEQVPMPPDSTPAPWFTTP